MVPRIDGGRDQRCGLRVGAGDNDELRSHHVRLSPAGDQAVDVLLHRHHHLSGHVTALLGARSLVLNVNSGGAGLNEHPNKFQRRRETSMARISISDDGSQVVDLGELQTLLGRQTKPFLPLLAVVEHLSFEEVVDLPRDSVLLALITLATSLADPIFHKCKE